MSVDLLNMDCMTYMRDLPDNAFDLAIVDPPYRNAVDNAPTKGMRAIGGAMRGFGDKPTKDYFNELHRVSSNQIVWGFNHLCDLLDPSSGFVYWHKHQNGNFAEGEIAWCSIGSGRFFDRPYQLDIGNKIHPTQKPVKLYQWLLDNYAEKGQRILDTHLGSGSSAIAAHYFGCDFVGIELDEDYYNAAKARFEQMTMQEVLF